MIRLARQAFGEDGQPAFVLMAEMMQLQELQALPPGVLKAVTKNGPEERETSRGLAKDLLRLYAVDLSSRSWFCRYHRCGLQECFSPLCYCAATSGGGYYGGALQVMLMMLMMIPHHTIQGGHQHGTRDHISLTMLYITFRIL